MKQTPSLTRGERRILTRRQTAERFGVSERTIIRMEQDGYLPPPIRIGAKRVGHWSDVEPLRQPGKPAGRQA